MSSTFKQFIPLFSQGLNMYMQDQVLFLIVSIDLRQMLQVIEHWHYEWVKKQLACKEHTKKMNNTHTHTKTTNKQVKKMHD